MWTASYASLSIIKPPLTPVSISRGKPRWLKGGWLAHCQPGVIGRNFDALAPTYKALKGSEEAYHRDFAALLRSLDPAATYADLGENAVLLCFCAPGKMCHRRIVAEWLEIALGIMVPELGFDRRDTPLWTTPTYHFRAGMEEFYDRLADRLEAEAAKGAT